MLPFGQKYMGKLHTLLCDLQSKGVKLLKLRPSGDALHLECVVKPGENTTVWSLQWAYDAVHMQCASDAAPASYIITHKEESTGLFGSLIGTAHPTIRLCW
jgi:hypothetical protein